MTDIVTGFMETFGVTTPPTDFPTFMYWLCSLVASLMFVRIIFGTLGGIYKRATEVTK